MFVHFKTVFNDEVMVMHEEDLTEESFNELGITEFWYEAVEDENALVNRI